MMTQAEEAATWGVLEAVGGEPAPIDAAEVRRAAALLFDPSASVELMKLPYGKRAVVPASDLDAVVRQVSAFAAGATGVYFSVNPVAATLGHDMKVGDALGRRWLDIDIDPDRPKGENATDAEHSAARDAASAIHGELSGYGWPAPVLLDSGNGWRLLYRIDLPNNMASRVMIRRVLDVIAKAGGSPGVVIDFGTAAANCHCKVPGTWARKGPHSPHRPHRVARVAHAPAEVAVVPTELLQELAGPEPPPKPPPQFWQLRVPGKGAKAYGRAALDREIQRVLLSRAGDGREGRNTTLNRAAFSVYQLVAGGVLEDAEATSELMSAALAVGLPEREARGVIDRARADGARCPRVPPQAMVANSNQASPAALEPGQSVTVLGSDIQPRPVEWLWHGRIPLGKLTTFAGIGGLGKTFVLCDVTARVTRGLPWPDGAVPPTPGRVLFVSGEDEPDDTLVPRMMEMEADLDRVRFLRTEVLDTFTLRDLRTLDRAMEELKGEASLVVIDPPTAYLGGVDDHKNAELRGLLSPLKGWAAKHRVAVVFNTHVNKGTGQKVEAMMRVMGSVAWVNAVRAAHMFARDPEDHDKRLFVGMKLNLGKEKKGLAYRIVETPTLARIEWLGEVDVTADQAVNQTPTKTRRVVASEWLVERFREKLEWPSDELFEAAKEANVSRNAVFEAKARLDLPNARKTVRPNGDVAWVWWVPQGWVESQAKDAAKDVAKF